MLRCATWSSGTARTRSRPSSCGPTSRMRSPPAACSPTACSAAPRLSRVIRSGQRGRRPRCWRASWIPRARGAGMSSSTGPPPASWRSTTKLKEYAASSASLAGRTIFTGEAADIPVLLNAMDIFVLPSISEGMSNTLLEAMASGLPVVATQVGGNPELIQPERCGWLFAPGDVNTLAAIVSKAARSVELRRAMGDAARRRAVEHFSLERMIESYRNLYVELARRRGLRTTPGTTPCAA
jgi:hypothetical protein